ncbi:hypothetical protein PR048_009439 [Dryococelus australis]|uniref:Uncharacterized protein n=1 Tax=Dryococelus australis TaxID=614101 RepID=A0ABQ9HZX7_9NEOP|nr:hypothetical protein PR048_009439 [Dryococelus australis]
MPATAEVIEDEVLGDHKALNFSPEAVQPYPKVSQQNACLPNRRKRKSAILTSTLEKQALEVPSQRRRISGPMKVKSTRKLKSRTETASNTTQKKTE